MPSSELTEPSRRTPIYGEFDVVVVGGGPAGIAAAIAAGRSGRSTICIERYGFCGGAGTAAGLSTFCGLHAVIHGKHEQVVHGIADDILDRLERMDGLNKPHLTIRDQILAQAYDISGFKIAADELLAESKVHVLFHAFATGVVMASDDRIEAVLVETKSGRFAIRGRIFIDGSGDGDLSAWAGVPYEVGDGAGNMLYPSTMFRITALIQRRRAERGSSCRSSWKKRSSAAAPSRARSRSFGRNAIRSSGARTSRRSRTRTAQP